MQSATGDSEEDEERRKQLRRQKQEALRNQFKAQMNAFMSNIGPEEEAAEEEEVRWKLKHPLSFVVKPVSVIYFSPLGNHVEYLCSLSRGVTAIDLV
jgi:hypothetical protein